MQISAEIPRFSVSMRDLGRLVAKSTLKQSSPQTQGQAEDQAIQQAVAKHLDGHRLLAEDEAHFSKSKDYESLLKEWLETEAGFATEYVRIRGSGDEYVPVQLDEYQVDLLNSQNKFVFCKKSRRVGISYTTSLRGVIKAHRRAGIDSIYISKTLDEAKEKIKYALEIYQAMPAGIRKKLASRSVRAQLEFMSKDGKAISRLISHPQTEPRGREGDIYLDEMASYLHQRPIYAAAIPCVVRDGTLWIVSTPRGKGDLFYAIDSATENEYKSFEGGRFNIPWWHCKIMVKDGMLEEAKVTAPSMTTEERVYRYGSERLIAVFESSPSIDDFCREMELMYTDESKAFFPDKLIFPCLFSGIEAGWDGAAPNRSPIEEKLLRRGVSHYWTKTVEDLIANFERGLHVGRSFVAGLDPGLSDGCAISIVDETEPALPIVRCVQKLVGVEHSRIEDLAAEIMKRLPIRMLRIDTRSGEGRALVSNLVRRVEQGGERIEGASTDNTILNDMASDLKRRLESVSVAIPNDDDLVRDLKRVDRVLTDGLCIPTIKVRRDKAFGHGDNYFALGYALGALDPTVEAVPQMTLPDYAAAGVPKRIYGRAPAAVITFKEFMSGARTAVSRSSDDLASFYLPDMFSIKGLPKP